MEKKLFSDDLQANDQLYKKFRERDDLSKYRERIEKLWIKYSNSGLADTNFRTEFATHFLSRFWEIILGCFLIESFHNVEKGGSRECGGPDFKCKKNDHSVVYIEATCPEAGNGINCVKAIEPNSSGWVPVDQVVLRLTSGLDRKKLKYCEYVEKGLVEETSPFVVAINGCGIPHAVKDSDPPFILQALFPLGSPYVSIDPIDSKIVGQGYSHQTEITKKGTNNPVRKDIFLNTAYSGISAVIYSQLHPFFMFNPTMKHYKIIYNPYAKNPLPRGFWGTGFEYWYENQIINRECVCET